jgi:CHAT domain-containing protein
LHAAGDHEAPYGPTVLDRAVSSYTPTLRALVEARNPLPDQVGEPSLLAVTVGEAQGEVPLATVAAERDMLLQRFAGRCTLRDGQEATIAEVRHLLPAHRWVHFACHGDQILDDPSRGGLRLSDDVLTIAQISNRQYHGDFAFLSACKTATGGIDLADEAITLAAALHYTGYRHVIGTLWTVYEAAAVTVADAVYAGVGPDSPFEPALSAWRLHNIVRELRKSERLSVWTPFIHTGP